METIHTNAANENEVKACDPGLIAFECFSTKSAKLHGIRDRKNGCAHGFVTDSLFRGGTSGLSQPALS